MKSFYTTETIYTKKTKRKLTPLAIQKILGVILAILGIVTCVIFKENGSAGLFLVFMGIARVISNYTEEE